MLQGIFIILLLGTGIWLFGNNLFPSKESFGAGAGAGAGAGPGAPGCVVQRSAKYQYGMSCKDYENYWKRPKQFCGHCIYSPYIPDTLCDRTLRKITHKGEGCR